MMKWIMPIALILPLSSHAQPDDNPLGQTIQIDTRFHSFVGHPILSLIIRDVDHDQNIPYLFDIERGENHWIALTFGRNYLISASSLQIETYQSGYNKYKNYRIKNFCNLESKGRIQRGESMVISIEGDLTPDASTYSCTVSAYPDAAFFIYQPPEDTDTQGATNALAQHP